MLLKAVQPFDFAPALRFIARFPPTTGEQEVTDSSLVKGFRVAGQDVLARVSAAPGGLRCELEGDRLTPEVVAAAADRVRFHLSLDDDLTGFYELADGVFADVVEHLRGYHQVKFPSPLEALVWAILVQRTRSAGAAKAKAAISAHVGNAYAAFPDLDQLLSLSAGTLAELVRHSVKGPRLHEVLRAWAEADESWLREAPYEEVKRFLLDLPGVGAWSASFILVRGLGRMDETPVERQLMAAAERVYGRPFSERDLRKEAARYGPWQGYWAHYLRLAE
ncbi:hypothetical protein [Nonomuraea sp. NPDC050310]|uniref:DNA-3-methyladenine glycosylase family protein n=1 Tax=unclassified Nonomuraea TaxID=2593643 RepID=UPI003406F28E